MQQQQQLLEQTIDQQHIEAFVEFVTTSPLYVGVDLQTHARNWAAQGVSNYTIRVVLDFGTVTLEGWPEYGDLAEPEKDPKSLMAPQMIEMLHKILWGIELAPNKTLQIESEACHGYSHQYDVVFWPTRLGDVDIDIFRS